MALIAQQRHAIEQALALTPEKKLEKSRRILCAAEDWGDDCLCLVGISHPLGTNSSSTDVVGVLAIRRDTDQPLHSIQLRQCDAIVLARAAEPEERAKSPLGKSALHIIEVLEILEIDEFDPDLGQGFHVSKLPFSSEYVAC